MKIKLSNSFALLLTDNGEVYSWGLNNLGQLGIGFCDEKYHTPSKINFPDNIPIRSICVGENFAGAIDVANNVYMWGSNHHGQLGLIDKVNRSLPSKLFFSEDITIVKLYCKKYKVMALTNDGKIYTWGAESYYYFLDLDISCNQECGNHVLINFPDNVQIKKIYAGVNHTFVIDTLSNVYSWGSNTYDQLCDGTNIDREQPFLISSLSGLNIKQIICGFEFTLILSDNKLYSIGNGFDTDLGIGLASCIKNLSKINLPDEDYINKIYGDYGIYFCTTAKKNVYKLETPYFFCESDAKITKVDTLSDMIFEYFSCSLDTAYGITNEKEIYTWGKNLLESSEIISSPVKSKYFDDNDIPILSSKNIKSANKL